MKKVLIILILLTLTSCNFSHYHLYNKDRTNGVNFSTGKWLIGDIDVNKNIKEDFTEIVIKDFKEILGERVKYSLNEKYLLLSNNTPLNPSIQQIKNVKKGTNYDYYINIKCKNNRNDLSDFNLIEHNYYIKQMSFALLTLEIYDLNEEKIIYTQTVSGDIDEHMSITSRPMRNIILGCYKKTIEDLKKKSILK